MSGIDDAAVRGRLILGPVLNPAALAAGTCGSAGVNLNRAFVDGAGTHPARPSIGHRIAQFVRDRIWPHVQVILDLHASRTVARFAPTTSFHRVDDPPELAAMIETARWLAPARRDVARTPTRRHVRKVANKLHQPHDIAYLVGVEAVDVIHENHDATTSLEKHPCTRQPKSEHP